MIIGQEDVRNLRALACLYQAQLRTLAATYQEAVSLILDQGRRQAAAGSGNGGGGTEKDYVHHVSARKQLLLQPLDQSGQS